MEAEEFRNLLGPFLLAVEGCSDHVQKEQLKRHGVVNHTSGFQNIQHLFWPSINPEQHGCETPQRLGYKHQNHEAIFGLARVGFEN